MGLPDLDEQARTRAEERLRAERIVWITTVRDDGRPQSSPVGFVWDGTRFLVLSQPGAPKVANIARNPKVALHLELDETAEDGGVLTVEGTAELEAGPLQGPDRSEYVDKYFETMRAEGLTPEDALAAFSTVIRIVPTRARSY